MYKKKDGIAVILAKTTDESDIDSLHVNVTDEEPGPSGIAPTASYVSE